MTGSAITRALIFVDEPHFLLPPCRSAYPPSRYAGEMAFTAKRPCAPRYL